MKNYIKAMVTFIFLMAAVAFVPNVVDAAVGVPGNLRQTDADIDSIEFTWDAVPNADFYETSWSTDGTNWSDWSDDDWYSWYGTVSTINKLTAGSTYYVKVRAVEDGESYLDPDIPGQESAVLEVVTAPSASMMRPVITTSTLDTSIGLSWNAAYGATSYDLKNGYANNALFLTTTLPSATVTGLTPATWYGIDIYPVRTSSAGYKAYSEYVHNYLRTSGQSLNNSTNTGTVTAPATPSTANFGTSGASASTFTLSFWASDPNRKSNGYEVEVRKIKGNKLVSTIDSTSTYSRSIKVGKNTPYKYRIRLYAVSSSGKLYSGWSSYRYFCIQKIKGKKHWNSRSKWAKLKLNWGKVTGASGYTVYMSTARDGKYKKVKSLGKNAKSVTLTKYGKSKLSKYKTYYVKVVPKIKDGKKTIKNDTQLINYNY